MNKYFAAAIGFTAILGLAQNSNAATNNFDEDYCREFSQKIKIGNRVETGYGTACYQQDGSWQIVKPAEIEQQIVSNNQQVVEYQPVFAPPPQPVYSSVIFYPTPRHYARPYYYHGHHGHGYYRY